MKAQAACSSQRSPGTWREYLFVPPAREVGPITVDQIVQDAVKQWPIETEIQRMHVTISAEVDALAARFNPAKRPRGRPGAQRDHPQSSIRS